MKVDISKIFLFFLLLTSNVFAASDTREASTKPKEIYGDATKEIGLSIGNGGAGTTGILKVLAEDFLLKTHGNYSIAWYQDISPMTLKQLQNGKIDVALVYDKNQSNIAIKEDWASNYTLIFNDHFIIVGPKENPAQLKNNDSVRAAFKKIANVGEEKSQNIFISRDDNSGTNIKEKAIWGALSMAPWQQENNWYYKFHTFPREALIEADKKHLYSLTDFATFLSTKENLTNTVIYISGGDLLLNHCYALLQKNPSKNALEFLKYLKSERAQKLIADFGKDKFGEALFTKASQKDF